MRLPPRSGLRLLLRVARSGPDLPLDQVERVDAERPADEADHQKGAEPHSTGTAHRHAAQAAAAPVLDVVATSPLM